MNVISTPSLARQASLFWNFFKIGFFTLGGGLAMIPFFINEFVDKKKWVTNDQITEMIALAQSLPGVVAINISIIIGHHVARKSGALCAVVGTVLPAFLSIVLILMLLSDFEDNPYVLSFFVGIKAASAALILSAVVRMARKALKNSIHWALAAVSLIIVMFGFSAAWSVVLGAIGGLIFFRKTKQLEGEQ